MGRCSRRGEAAASTWPMPHTGLARGGRASAQSSLLGWFCVNSSFPEGLLCSLFSLFCLKNLHCLSRLPEPVPSVGPQPAPPFPLLISGSWSLLFYLIFLGKFINF
jgi:hypothetical protein